MFVVLNQVALRARPLLRQTMLWDRARQFVDRHGWQLCLDASGGEMDEFDDEWTTYCLVVEGERHLASARLRPAHHGTMVARHFPEFEMAALRRLDANTEITRLCTSPELSASDRVRALSDLLLGLCRHCQQVEVARFFGVVFPAVSRVFNIAGWRGEEVEAVPLDGRQAILQVWYANELTSWKIQEARAIREDRLRKGRQTIDSRCHAHERKVA